MTALPSFQRPETTRPATSIDGVTVYHAGTAHGDNGTLTTAGGRVLNVTALAPTLAEAREKAYQAVDRISFEGKQYRTDIARAAAEAAGEA